ncbi:MAG: peroxiredoxin [Beijerinckiaceae bacterium]|nr:peroxiredoxin [Beijerinckiaceae bacterium]
MQISVGDALPQTTFRVMTSDGPAPKTTAEAFDGRKIVLFAVPGAFTPTCHKNHLPSFLTHLDAIKARGVDAVVCTSTNDAFVMNAWAEHTGAKGKIEFLSDGNGDFASALGLSMDGTGFGLGIRSKRYAMIVDDGKVSWMAVEDVPSKADASSAEAVLSHL